ncbi:unnamed protein product, partial [Oppiella nova]
MLMIVTKVCTKADCPLVAHVVQSVTNCLNATTLYVTSIVMVVIAGDRYYLITNVFESPFDAISTRLLLAIIWTVCINDENYLVGLNTDHLFRQITRLMRFSVQFVIPSLLIGYFCAKIIFHLNSTQ